MNDPLMISKAPPPLKSMDYTLLREEAIKYIERVSGKIWTDYNTTDPGITILEVLCYALTDLGYRTSYDMKDILAEGPIDQGLFTAREILTTRPVILNDYRKLLIDVEVIDEDNPDCTYAGIKNAWLEKAPANEVPVYPDKKNNALSYAPSLPGQDPLNIQILYDVLLEFDRCDAYGDLNENTLHGILEIPNHAPDPELSGISFEIRVEFPRWDNETIDWNDDASIRKGVIRITVRPRNVPAGFTFGPISLTSGNRVKLSGTKATAGGLQEIPGLNSLSNRINNFIYTNTDNLLDQYKLKIGKIQQIITEASHSLQANRNLCEDFLRFSALRIEEILLCSDIELALDADVEQVQAQIYYQIARFLSPTVYFYTLDEMFYDCQQAQTFDLQSIDQVNRTFSIAENLTAYPEPGEKVSVIGSNSNNGAYTVVQSTVIEDGGMLISVEEFIPSAIVTEGEQLFLGEDPEKKCRPTEEVFNGPQLQHGFIKDEELEKASRIRKIHVSDLIQIMMDVEGVLAVRNIQIANRPQDNEDGSIPERSVRWCLELAFEQNYVPRLNIDESRLTFYKDQLPFKASSDEVDELLEALANSEREQKRHPHPFNDIKPPKGRNRNIADHFSILNEFPLVYGVGEEGLPVSATNTVSGSKKPIKPGLNHTRQLKAYLLFFDQLLANYLSQLANVHQLFSIRSDIDKTYFTQTLMSDVLNTKELYLDEVNHADNLQNLVEDSGLYGERRNRFLDHLMSRFAEQFTDYALLTYRLSGPAASEELIEDKLAFLKQYPEISAGRGTAFNYRHPCKLWHLENRSGLEDRANLLLGIAPPSTATLEFSPRYATTGTAPNLGFTVSNDVPEVVLESTKTYEEEIQVKEALERVVGNAVRKSSYQMVKDGSNVQVELLCDDEVLAVSAKKDFASDAPGGDADTFIDDLILLNRQEYLENAEANRRNLACPLYNYFNYTISIDLVANPAAYNIQYTLYKKPFSTAASDVLLNDTYTGNGNPKRPADIQSVNLGANTIRVTGNVSAFLVAGVPVLIDQSADNDGEYTIVSATPDGDDTVVELQQPLASNNAPPGVMQFNEQTESELEELAESRVDEVLFSIAEANAFSVPETPAEEELVTFLQEKFFTREGFHLVEHILLRPKTAPGDELLAINLDESCSCPLNDPYTCIAHVILPYWPGRHRNTDFRKFFERTLRLEAPAHVYLNICWVNCHQLAEFEQAYKAWLLENARVPPNETAGTDALNNLVNSLEGLRNVYPAGTLHDCEEDDSLDNAIILNNSTLGN